MRTVTAPPDGLALLSAIRNALATSEGRAVAREIVRELRLADDEAASTDPVGAEVDAAFARARSADRRRAAK